jgi:murein L,D-transpeptidase YcbB/YkuD
VRIGNCKHRCSQVATPAIIGLKLPINYNMNLIIKQAGYLLTGTVLLATLACSSGDKNKGYFGNDDYSVEEVRATISEDMLDSIQIGKELQDLQLARLRADELKDFYRNNNYEPGWVNEDGITENARDFLKALEAAPAEGLNPAEYRYQELTELVQKLESDHAADNGIKEVARLDREFTAAYLKYASDLMHGRVDPSRYDELWKIKLKERDLGKVLTQALDDNAITESLEELKPQDPQYALLKKALKRYQDMLNTRGEWPELPADIKLEVGDSTQYVATLKRRLASDGYLTDKIDTTGVVYDSTLYKAVKFYQTTNGLEPDGVVGGNTLSMLNMSLQKRIDQIQLNLERLRWFSEKMEGRHIVVNIPQFMMYVYEGGEIAMPMKVIVGTAYENTTPVFTDSMEYISFSPTWTVPNSIATGEILPILKKNPGYLRSRNFKAYQGWDENAPELNAYSIDWNSVDTENFPYRFVQQPGPGNALGTVKFIFPNSMNIYLHDTPTESLFERAERDFSHGCIRVEKPVDLAYYLLQDQGLSREEVEGMMHQPSPENVRLTKKVPVRIDYRTAWVDEESGRVTFAKDIYGYDAKQMRQLDRYVATN